MQDSPNTPTTQPAQDRPWLAHYPEGVPAEVDYSIYPTLLDLFENSFKEYADRGYMTFGGVTLSYADVDRLSREMAAYLQTLGLQKGDRVAVMAPNVHQQPIAVLGALRAGYVVVNVNPLYTARELKHQLQDSGAKAIIIIENFAATLQQVVADTEVEHVVLTAIGDMLPFVKKHLVNAVVRHVKKMVPSYDLPDAVKFNEALKIGRKAGYRRPELQPDDLAILQYTGGTTGVAKGAELLHKTLVSAMLISKAWSEPAMGALRESEQAVSVCALPLYHVFALVSVHFLSMATGGRMILIANPRDLDAMAKSLKGETFHAFPGVNTLFTAMSKHPGFKDLDYSQLAVANGGGAAILEATAKDWRSLTGRTITQGYGLSETSSGCCCMPPAANVYDGSIGLPMPNVDMRILDEEGGEMPIGERGEIGVRAPLVMRGYWNRPEATAEAFTKDGFFRTGDIGVMDERGYFRIVDRKKDMIIVSGFNVYPNEIEDVMTGMPGLLECAAIGVPDDATGEAVRLYVVAEPGATIDAAAVIAYAKANMVAYKCPKQVEFIPELPKSPVGKILRRELRDQHLGAAG